MRLRLCRWPPRCPPSRQGRDRRRARRHLPLIYSRGRRQGHTRPTIRASTTFLPHGQVTPYGYSQRLWPAAAATADRAAPRRRPDARRASTAACSRRALSAACRRCSPTTATWPSAVACVERTATAASPTPSRARSEAGRPAATARASAAAFEDGGRRRVPRARVPNHPRLALSTRLGDIFPEARRRATSSPAPPWRRRSRCGRKASTTG